VITAGAEIQVLVATRPVDFRKQADGLAAIVQAVLGADPFSGTVYVFRSKRMEANVYRERQAPTQVKLLWWDGTGICLMMKYLTSECRPYRRFGAACPHNPSLPSFRWPAACLRRRTL
jgi:transposase